MTNFNSGNNWSSSNTIKNSSTEELKKRYDALRNLTDPWAVQEFQDIENELFARSNASVSENQTTALEKMKELLNNSWNVSKSEVKKLLEQHIIEYNKQKATSNTAQDKTLQDLLKQLNDTKQEKEQLEKKYNQKITENEKIIKIQSPIELTKRNRLRSILKKFNQYEKMDPAKAFAYFITKTSFWKGGKVTTWLKEAWLFLKNISLFSKMGEKQILEMKKKLQKAIDDLAPKDKDSATIKDLKNNIRRIVVDRANRYFAEISKPLQAKMNY